MHVYGHILASVQPFKRDPGTHGIADGIAAGVGR
jgi:hypothetical protein